MRVLARSIGVRRISRRYVRNVVVVLRIATGVPSTDMTRPGIQRGAERKLYLTLCLIQTCVNIVNDIDGNAAVQLVVFSVATVVHWFIRTTGLGRWRLEATIVVIATAATSQFRRQAVGISSDIQLTLQLLQATAITLHKRM